MQLFKIGKKAALQLIVGDLLVLFASLYASLFLRSGAIPILHTLRLNIYAFIPVFALWILGFFIYNLYARTTVSTSRNLPARLFQALVFNTVIAVVFFYIFPIRGVAPKTTLFIMFMFSYVLMYVWRELLFTRISRRPVEPVLIIGRTPEHEHILHELNQNPSLYVSAQLIERVTSDTLKTELGKRKARVVIIDTRSPETEELFSAFTPEEILKLRFVNPSWLYEELFGRIPLSHVTNTWLFTHVTYEQKVYDVIKRLLDIIIASILGVISLMFYPFVILLIKLEDGGPIFIHQTRVGKGLTPIRIIKFRSMTGNDQGNYESGRTTLALTRVGKFLRASRLDELPQLWNVIRGDLSLVGPRPELVPLVKAYAKEIPFYHVRHLIAPGLAGWAQINQIASATDPHHGRAVEATKEKLSYDFYYLKHRSFLLDIVVLLRTIQIMLSRQGS